MSYSEPSLSFPKLKSLSWMAKGMLEKCNSAPTGCAQGKV